MPQLRGSVSSSRFMKIVFPFAGGAWLVKSLAGVLEAELCRDRQCTVDSVGGGREEVCTHGLSVPVRLAVRTLTKKATVEA